MTPILTAAQMREADRRAVDEHSIPGPVLMENAARGACDLLGLLLGSMEGMRIGVVCGKGNNGGDGLALARHAAIRGADVRCALLSPAADLSADTAAQYRMLASFLPESIIPWERFRELHDDYDAIVDALLGTGSNGTLREIYAEAVGWMNDRSGLKLALDIPTGIDANTGHAAGDAFRADATATMAALKPGLLLGNGVAMSGDLYVISIGTPPLLYRDSGMELLDRERALAGVPDIETERNKYDRGKVLVAAGSRGMTGAGVMAAEAALRAGAGLTVLALPESAAALPQRISPEIMTLALPSDEQGAFAADAFGTIIEGSVGYAAIALGPGLSRSAAAADAVRALVRGSAVPVVLDADGLNAFARRGDELRERSCDLVITPHHGEMARLIGTDRLEIGRDPICHAREAAAQFRCIVVLKGAPTIIALPDGHVWINSAGNPGMATGGTGDVLTGMIASLIAQGGDPIDGTLTATWLHSHAADLAVDEGSVHSLVATDIIDYLPQAYRSILASDE